MELLCLVSRSRSSITSHEDHGQFQATHAWHDARINKLGTRNELGDDIAPNVIVIYRGTNDFSHAPYTWITQTPLDELTNTLTTDILDNGFDFREGLILTVERIQERYPTSTLVLSTLNYFKRVNFQTNPVHNGLHTIHEYNEAILEIADNYHGNGKNIHEADSIGT